VAKRGRKKKSLAHHVTHGTYRPAIHGPLPADFVVTPPAPPVIHARQASRAIAHINQLTHTKGPHARQAFQLRPWQVRILRQLFTQRRDRRRQYRTVLLMLPRKNGKTELAAALAVYFLLFDGEVGGEVYSAAADRDQASLVFHVAAQMIRNDPTLEAQVEIVDSQKRIVHPASGSLYRAISAEAYSKHGFNASVVIYDELHAAPTRELWDVLATSQGARAQPLMMAISTAGFDRASILYELYAHGKRVREDPTIDPTFLPVIYEAPADADWRDEKTWKRANPALGDFRSLDEMRSMCQRAQEIPAQENSFRRLYLNQWTEQASRWLSLAHWEACARATPVSYAGRPCYVGLDLSSTTDTTALVAVYPDADGPGFDVRVASFVPEATLQGRVTRERLPYDEWRRRGWIVATPGNVVDYERVRAELRAWGAESDVREVAYDPWNATDLVTRLSTQDGFSCVPVRQGFASLTAPTKSLETAVLGRMLRHDGHPVLQAQVSHVAVESDAAGNLKPSKVASTDRIDLVVALILAIDRKDRHGAVAPPPQYAIHVFGGVA
jgi:phage terminase large subunit-like protein